MFHAGSATVTRIMQFNHETSTQLGIDATLQHRDQHRRGHDTLGARLIGYVEFEDDPVPGLLSREIGPVGAQSGREILDYVLKIHV